MKWATNGNQRQAIHQTRWNQLDIGNGFHAFSRGRGGRSFLLQLAGFLHRIGALLDFFELGHRNGIPPLADPSFLQNAEVDRVFLSDLRDAGPGRRSMFWVATHRIHHQFSDKDGDPHTPRDGKWWSHIVWMLVGDATHCNVDECSRYAPDICKDRFLVWLSKYHYVPLAILSILLLAFGGLPFLLWGVFFRVTMGLHATWMVNSLTHFWGSRRFATRDGSRNNWFVALLSFGEGWHNNHHAHPTSARHGLAWYEIDMSWWRSDF